MSHYHAVVWIDHQKAVTWQFTATEQQGVHIHSSNPHPHIHNRKALDGGHKAPADHTFFDEVATALTGAHEILLLGPAQTKQEFAAYVREKLPLLGRCIVAIESSDHPTDAQVLAYARQHFKALDRMQ